MADMHGRYFDFLLYTLLADNTYASSSPGRFFASNELKAVLAQIILNYDVKLGGDGSHPPDVYVSLNIIPALRGCVLFKKREPLV